MNLNISEINEMRPLLLLYSSGTGGEFITNMISQSSDEFNTVDYHLFKENNMTSARCCTYYGALWENPDDPKTWIDPTVSDQDKTKRVILKDHPSLYFAKYYWRHLSNLQVIHLAVKEEIEYFSKLAINKLAFRVNSDDVNKEYVTKYISETATPERINNIIKWARAYPWVWGSELQTLNSHLSKGVDVSDFYHDDDIDVLVQNQFTAMSWESGQLRTYLSEIYTNYTTVNVDSLAYNGIEFWNQIKKCVPSVDTAKCIKHTNYWIKKNHNIMTRGPRQHNG
jgi:hypothetical protein